MNGTEERLVRVENDIKELRSDVAGIKASLGHMATKEDLAELKVSMSEDMAEFKASVSEDMTEFKASMSEDMASLARHMAEIKGSVQHWATKEDFTNARHDVTKAKLAMVTSMLAAAVAIGTVAAKFVGLS